MSKLRTWGEAMKGGGLDSYDNYMGEDWMKDWYMLVGRSRDSSVLEQSNFDAALKLLGGESETVQIVRFNHWAVGWIEELMISPEDSRAVEIALDIKTQLESYPVLDESDFSQREYNQAVEYWTGLPLRERIELCARFGVSIFSARSKSIPEDDCGRLYEYLTTD